MQNKKSEAFSNDLETLFMRFLTKKQAHENGFHFRQVYLKPYPNFMKKAFFILSMFSLLNFSCKSDDVVTCSTCSSDITSPFELCKETNGNASVNGQDTGVKYNIYMEGLVNEGVSCN